MKHKALLLFSVLFGLIVLPCFGQESDAAQENSVSENNVSENTTSENNASQEEKTDAELPHKKKSLVQVASSVFQPLPEENEEEDSDVGHFVTVMGNFLMDKHPLTIDFGAEPKEHGSSIFGNLQYNWNKKYASALKVTYLSENETEDSGSLKNNVTHIVRQKKSIKIQFDPFIRYFGDSSATARTPLFVLRLGVQTQLFNGDVDGIRFSMDRFDTYTMNQKMVILAPYIGFGFFLPFLKYFEFFSQTNIAPVFGEMERKVYDQFWVSIEDPEDPKLAGRSDSRTLHTISTPIIQQNFALTLFRYIRIASQLNFQRLEYSLPGTADDTYEQFQTSLKYGLEIVLPSRTARRGDNHLWAGLYYQHTWNYSTDSNNFTHDGKVVLSFGS